MLLISNWKVTLESNSSGDEHIYSQDWGQNGLLTMLQINTHSCFHVLKAFTQRNTLSITFCLKCHASSTGQSPLWALWTWETILSKTLYFIAEEWYLENSHLARYTVSEISGLLTHLCMFCLLYKAIIKFFFLNLKNYSLVPELNSEQMEMCTCYLLFI